MLSVPLAEPKLRLHYGKNEADHFITERTDKNICCASFENETKSRTTEKWLESKSVLYYSPDLTGPCLGLDLESTKVVLTTALSSSGNVLTGLFPLFCLWKSPDVPLCSLL